MGSPVFVPSLSDVVGTLLCRDEPGRAGSGTRTIDRDEREEYSERVLRCLLCTATITSPRERTSRNRQHLHTVFNPAGIVYEIGCFQKAPGCLVHGPTSRDFTWFAGYAWRVAFCAVCAEHLGWHFSTGEDAFFGLIVNRLTDG